MKNMNILSDKYEEKKLIEKTEIAYIVLMTVLIFVCIIILFFLYAEICSLYQESNQFITAHNVRI